MKVMVRHYVAPDFKSYAVRMSDGDYSKALDSLVIACVDIVIVHKELMLIGKRTVEPQSGWWIIGGRMIPGESFTEAAARNVKRELSLNIKPFRFKYLNTQSMVSPIRAQPPKNHGCHTVSIAMTLTITNNEAKDIKSSEEYEELKWMSPKDIVNGNSLKPHPALVQHAKDLIDFSQ